MSHTRRSDQSVDAFSLPTDLLAKSKLRAAELGMTKSGFYRYCLAKELGHDETTARAYAAHRAVLNSIENSFAMNDAPAKENRVAKKVSYKTTRTQKLRSPK